ncbi:hypothetical protein [Rhodosalinus sp.]|uniref:hypothetical protein n=1 Tax=Rhodosalinus sp. TaxID=2047741 RepID=UPI0035669759
MSIDDGRRGHRACPDARASGIALPGVVTRFGAAQQPVTPPIAQEPCRAPPAASAAPPLDPRVQIGRRSR